MQQYQSQYQSQTMARPRTEVVNAFMRGVYLWMTLGLGVTALLAFGVDQSLGLKQFLFGSGFPYEANPTMLYVLIFAELGLVMGLSFLINKMNPAVAMGLFLLYSALNGLTIGAILLFYSKAAVFQAFIATAGMFAAMSAYGLLTKKDLTSWGSFLFMGLLGIIIASVVNIFIGSSTMSWIISIIGVIVFTGLTAYDTQQLKIMGQTTDGAGDAAVKKATIMGALRLYLDFINLFLMLLRLLGGRE
ncbi:MAG: Bax inhibitor-1/YccA family protein [Desulfovibrio sp.]|nr:MAG: Bax inhibitor-1/YccA family protein [Desulfovibrio sp.]